MTGFDLERPLSTAFLLEPGLVYLNHGSYGACPIPVLEAQTGWRTRLERQPVRFFSREFEAALDRCRERLASTVGARPEDLVPVRNATAAVNAVVRSQKLAPGDRLLTTDHVYNACGNVLDLMTCSTGAEVVRVHLPWPVTDPEEIVSRVVAAVDSRTRLALLDHVTSPTALVLPLEKLVPALEARGVPVLVDGAHAPGQIPLDLDSLGASYYTGNAHKWFCTPRGAGFLHAREDRQPGLVPAILSHGWNLDRPGRSRFQDLFDWTGTDDPSAFLCLPDALDFLASLHPGGIPAVMERNHALVLAGARILEEEAGARRMAPPTMNGSMATLEIAADPVSEGSRDPSTFPGAGVSLGSDLWNQDRIEVPIGYWPAVPRRTVRISAQVYNRLDDYRALAAALVRHGAGRSQPKVRPAARP